MKWSKGRWLLLWLIVIEQCCIQLMALRVNTLTYFRHLIFDSSPHGPHLHYLKVFILWRKKKWHFIFLLAKNGGSTCLVQPVSTYLARIVKLVQLGILPISNGMTTFQLWWLCYVAQCGHKLTVREHDDLVTILMFIRTEKIKKKKKNSEAFVCPSKHIHFIESSVLVIYILVLYWCRTNYVML